MSKRHDFTGIADALDPNGERRGRINQPSSPMSTEYEMRSDDAGRFSVSMLDAKATALREIADPACRQKDVAQTLAFAVRQGEMDAVCAGGEVARAAISRWSMSGWTNIKRLAWSGKACE